MAIWPETDTVGDNELIGRRIFENPIFLPGTESQFHPKHFMPRDSKADKNVYEDVSVDRLGQFGAAIKKVHIFLTKDSIDDAKSRKPPRDFLGWALCRAKNLDKHLTYTITISGEDKGFHKYHAEIPLGPEKDIKRARQLSVLLAHYYSFHPDDKFLNPYSDAEPESSNPPRVSLWDKLWGFFSGLVKKP